MSNGFWIAYVGFLDVFFFSSRRRHTRCALVTGVQTCALPILASYLLIGFWFKKPSANAAAIKAFVVNRVGDLGFMLGIFGTYLVFQTVSIPEILQAAPDMAGSTIGFLGMRWDTMTLLCLLFFVGDRKRVV